MQNRFLRTVLRVSYPTSGSFYENRNKPPIFNQQNNLRKVENTGFLQVYKNMLMAADVLKACTHTQLYKDNDMTYAFRLTPGEDLRLGIEKIVHANAINAGWIATCAGSLTHYAIRFANQPEGSSGEGYFEIVSLTGTISIQGNHLHICISDSTGKTIGGHLLEGCKIYTTAEIVIIATEKYIFNREKDGTTPWRELQIKELK